MKRRGFLKALVILPFAKPFAQSAKESKDLSKGLSKPPREVARIGHFGVKINGHDYYVPVFLES